MEKTKPILFSTPMVQAILAGRKTQTRRVNNHPYFTKEELLKYTLPKFNVGDILWVRETFEIVPVQVASVCPDTPELMIKNKVKYKADGNESFKRWTPSIFMPKEHARLFLKVTEIRLERLQEITEADAIAEGVKRHSDYGSTGYVHYGRIHEALTDIDAVLSFRTLWETINGIDSWRENPFVWVYTFERINKPAEFK